MKNHHEISHSTTIKPPFLSPFPIEIPIEKPRTFRGTNRNRGPLSRCPHRCGTPTFGSKEFHVDLSRTAYLFLFILQSHYVVTCLSLFSFFVPKSGGKKPSEGHIPSEIVAYPMTSP